MLRSRVWKSAIVKERTHQGSDPWAGADGVQVAVDAVHGVSVDECEAFTLALRQLVD